MKNKRKLVRRTGFTVLILFVLLNIIAFLHAYRFTHFSETGVSRTPHPDRLSLFQKIKVAATGVSNPRPKNDRFPAQDFTTIKLQSNKVIEGWLITADESVGTVIVAHGFAGEKSSMLDKAEIFLGLGYSVFLIDFMGSGGSEGNQTTIGFYESEQIRTSFEYIKNKGEENIILFGTSMGAVAIMKALSDFDIRPSSIILECPFGTMYETVCARFRSMNIPRFPMAALLVFWGGVQNGFWAFGHNPKEYAKQIELPTLLMYGEQDERVSRKETDEIFANLRGSKKLSLFALSGHESYLTKYREKWSGDVKEFFKKVQRVRTTKDLKIE